MNTAASGLKELHQLHRRLTELRDEIERGPKQIQARRQFAQRKQEEQEAQKKLLLEQRKLADGKNLQLRTNESKINDLKGKLNTASSNREYDIIRGQIDADTMANSVLEDEILEALEKVDQTQIVCKKLEAETSAAATEAQRVTDRIASAEPALKAEAARLASEIADSEKGLPADVAQVYRRLINAHGARALAPAVNGACSECYVSLMPQTRVNLNSGKIVFCNSCGRLLYLLEGA